MERCFIKLTVGNSTNMSSDGLYAVISECSNSPARSTAIRRGAFARCVDNRQ